MNNIPRYLITLLYTALCLPAIAQQPLPDTSWGAPVMVHTVPAGYTGSAAIVITQEVKISYLKDNENLWVYRTVHRLVKVLDDKGIEGFNKMTIPTSGGRRPVTLKARTISPAGRVYDITPDKIKETKNEEGASELSFAMEGVEKGAEIELLHTDRRPFTLFGTEIMQYTIPVLHASFELTCPDNLVFEEKGYNGFPTVKDTLTGKVRYIRAVQDNIPALAGEPYSFADAYRMRAEYKISYLPEEHENMRIYTWKDLAKQIYENTYQLTDKENKAVDKYLETLGVKDRDSEVVKIEKIENGIKTGITYYRDIPDDNASRLDNVISKKSATAAGLNRLFAACFTQAGVKHELGIVPDRFQYAFDNDFENWNNMDNYVFWFPRLNAFLYPTGMYYRYPVVLPSMLTARGVFCRVINIGSLTNAIADIKTVTPLPVAQSQNNIDASISFNKDMEAQADVTYSFTGYTALGVREALLLVPKDKQKELVLNIVNLAGKPDDLVKYTTANEAFENSYTGRPLQIIATVRAPQLVEKAGPKYLLKIGDVIGSQAELYQEQERKLPVDLSYPHALNRTITVAIPNGYKVLNPEIIKISASLKGDDGQEGAAFYSDYKVEGNKLTVTINEFYSALYFPVSDYGAFRKVINASADFNKVVLLLGQ